MQYLEGFEGADVEADVDVIPALEGEVKPVPEKLLSS